MSAKKSKAKTAPAECAVCGRRPGDCVDRGGVYDGIPLGDLSPCEACGKVVCPDCLSERDCCFDSKWEDRVAPAPPLGWEVEGKGPDGQLTYHLIRDAGRGAR